MGRIGSAADWDEVEGGKNPWLGHLRSSHNVYTMPHVMPVDQRGLGSKPIGPITQLVPTIGAIDPVMT